MLPKRRVAVLRLATHFCIIWPVTREKSKRDQFRLEVLNVMVSPVQLFAAQPG